MAQIFIYISFSLLAPLCSVCHQFSRTGRSKDDLLEHLKRSYERYEFSSGCAEKLREACWRSTSHEPEGNSYYSTVAVL